MEKKQTAVEWLGLELNMIFHNITPELWEEVELKFQQAKQMEEEQIVNAWNGGDYAYYYSKETGRDFEDGEDYYNEVYGGEK
jgi:hypothetical protein